MERPASSGPYFPQETLLTQLSGIIFVRIWECIVHDTLFVSFMVEADLVNDFNINMSASSSNDPGKRAEN